MLYKSLGERNFPKQKKKNFFTHCKERKKERKKETIKEQNKQKKKFTELRQMQRCKTEKLHMSKWCMG